MKHLRTKLILVFAVCCMTASAAPQRKMLEEGKSWTYVYHHFEENGSGHDHSIWLIEYNLKGDTIIDGRQYMKVYRFNEYSGEEKYFGAFREDEEGRVYQYDYLGDGKDFKMIDFSMDYDDLSPYFSNVKSSVDAIITETIKVNGKLFRRYRYQNIKGVLPNGTTMDIQNANSAVEGVGFQNSGLFHYLFEPLPTCICDYEELNFVSCRDFFFEASGFQAPKEIELTDSEKELIASNNDFAFNLFRKARGENNSVLSPLSITYALGMLNNAADGETLQEINQTLGFGDAGADAINAFCRKMLTESQTLDNQTKALIANTIFVNEGFGFRLQEGFIKKANDYYDAEPQNRDFADGLTMAVINQWASDHTEGLIQNLLNEESFDPTLASYLLNALYFKGAWKSPFDEAKTKEEEFGYGAKVPMMHKPYTEFNYTENDLYQAVNLPYGNGAYLMTIFLPREDKTIGDVLESLNGSNWQVGDYRCDVDVKLPRFETETKKDLNQIMSDLGMPKAFTRDAEFPYFCNVPVFISKMFQVAKIKLDEKGTEAAAVTVIGLAGASMPKQAEFHANRPFFYVISEQSTGVIFFMGQYTGSVTSDIPAPHRLTPTEDRLYNLQGQRLSMPPTRGIYIHNGKKVIVK